jgi:uncharacterized protein (TIGR03083 family)
MDLARRVELITADSDALADAATHDLTAPIVACPDWTMVDLVRHVLQVHRSWALIVAEQRTGPDWADEPMPDDDALVDEFRVNAHRFAAVLGAADPESPCWTWGPEQNAGFVQRFQVQEVALHRWDAERAVGHPEPIATDGAADAIAQLAELFPLMAEGATHSFDVVLDDAAGTVPILTGPDRTAAGSITGTASDVLLVLWRRLPLAAVEVDGDPDAIAAALVAARFD